MTEHRDGQEDPTTWRRYSLGRSVLDLDDVARSMAPTSVVTKQLANAAACHVAVQMAGVSRTAEMFVASQITQAATQNVARQIVGTAGLAHQVIGSQAVRLAGLAQLAVLRPPYLDAFRSLANPPWLEALGRFSALQLSIPDVATPMLLTHRAKDFLTPVIRSIQENVWSFLTGWGEVFRKGLGALRGLARAALNAALRARDAVLHGSVDELDRFIVDWLDLPVTSWRRDAVAQVLLEGEWIPEDLVEPPFGLMDDLRVLTRRAARNYKRLGDTEIGGRRLDSLDRPVLLGADSVPLVSMVSDPRADAALAVPGGFESRELCRLVAQLKPDEQRIVGARGAAERTWAEAAVVVGLRPEDGESVRRKCKRLAEGQRQRSAAARLVREAQARGDRVRPASRS